MMRLLSGLIVALFAGSAAVASDLWHEKYFPNVVLTDQDGVEHKFYDDLIKGRIVAISFIYTNCNEICPADTAQLMQVKDMLKGRVGKDIFFFSISIDPDNDTPKVLKRYKEMFGIGPEWPFLTARNLEDVTLLQRKLGLIGKDKPILKEHNTSVIVGNEVTEQWIKRSPYDHPKLLVNLLGEQLRNFSGTTNAKLKPFSAASENPNVSRGELLFRSRCTACHTIGGGDKLGPDLKGVVTSRDPAWLNRWLLEPDKMIAEGEPLATALRARYRNMPMPNFSLGDVEVDALIDYMKDPDKKPETSAVTEMH